jgi:hypothetical protein
MKLTVGDDLAGKRVKCRACGQVFRVPGSGPGPESEATGPSQSPRAPKRVQTSPPAERVPCEIAPTPAPGPGDQKDATEDLKRVYQDFARPVGRSSVTFGCLTLLVILAAILSGIYVSWLLAVVGGIAVLAVMVCISNRLEAPHRRRAKARVAQLEKAYALSHQGSFDLLSAARSEAKQADKNEWKAFVTEVWGAAALTRERKQEQVPRAAAGSSNCPRCNSTSVERKSEYKSSTAGHVAGQVLFGIVGNVVLGAAFGRTIENCECKTCGHKWVNEKPGKPAKGPP